MARLEIIRVILADDHVILRDGLQSLLAPCEDIQVVGVAGSGLEVLHQVDELSPDVVVMDIGMPNLNGLEATRRIVRDSPGVQVLILSQHEDSQQILAAIEAGASGYVLKRSAGADLAQALRDVTRGGAVLPPGTVRMLMDAYLNRAVETARDSYGLLTDREREVLILVAEGHTSQQIADMLHVSPKTVDSHRTSLMSKLGFHDRTEVVKYALRRQLIEL